MTRLLRGTGQGDKRVPMAGFRLGREEYAHGWAALRSGQNNQHTKLPKTRHSV
jgi:hypothetical protein